MRIPVPTYHSMTVHGNEYGTNDHAAFRDDLPHSAWGMRRSMLNLMLDFRAGIGAKAQIARASAFIHDRASNRGAAFFAYPYGETNDT